VTPTYNYYLDKYTKLNTIYVYIYEGLPKKNQNSFQNSVS